MGGNPTGLSQTHWLSWPSAVRGLILSQQVTIEELRSRLIAQATELAGLRERIGRSSRHSSKHPSSEGPPPLRGNPSGHNPPEWRKASALVGLLGRAFPLSFSKTQVRLDQLLGVNISPGAITMASVQKRRHRLGHHAARLPAKPQAFVAILKPVVAIGIACCERIPWAKTMRTCQQLRSVVDGLWTFLEIDGIEPTNNAASVPCVRR